MSEWSASAINTDPKKQRFIEKLTQWADKFRDGVALAIEYSKPADAFKDVPDMDFLFDPMYASAGVQSQKPNQGNSLVFCSKLERMVQEGKETCPQ
ncbi:hypothetical protein KIK84_14745 [Curvibacter sp. CHRR-16]|uniref:hypothetical protein n=1 Tax=Curvibacter sp. CHRR-16 TaxID=2835872 RepID=UPI001BDB59B7|nr:hypothetical protein [Curvibacter sp. CHRR-16]MBT0571583.1 hypothetical protein [Curvibacter sp. CHRR-16]